MKLLYATSISYPSKLANRIQILNTSFEFEKEMGDQFILGTHNVELGNNFLNRNILNFKGSRVSLLLGFRYIYYIWKNKITHVYSREEMLYLSMYFFSYLLLWKRPKFIYEAHWMFKHKNSLINFLFGFVRKRSSLIVSITTHLKNELIKSGVKTNKIIVSPDGVRKEDYEKILDFTKLKQENNIPLNKKIFGYVGTYKTLDTKKGTDEILYAFSEIIKNRKDVFLLFVGAGEEGRMELTRDLLNLNVPVENFLIIDRVPHKEVADFLRICDFLLMTFPWTEHYAYIMSPMKLFEYMASGKPIITTDLPSVRDILDDSMCTFTTPGDEKELKIKMEYVLNNQDLVLEKAQKASVEVLKYTWQQRVSNILEKIKVI